MALTNTFGKNVKHAGAAAGRMFEQALNTIDSLADTQREPFWDSLDTLRQTYDNFGYGAGDEMDDLLAEYVGDD